MSRLMKLAAAFVSALTLLSGAAQAQNWQLRPSFGSISLSAGFLPDPRVRTIQAGGDLRLNPTGGCPGGGYIANAPDYRLHYRSGGYALSFYVRAPRDTILLINDPQGRWFCNDDYSGLDPAIRFGNPLSGQYDIWVGTYGRARVRNANLYITELGPFSR